MGGVLALCGGSSPDGTRARLVHQVELHEQQISEAHRRAAVLERAAKHLVAADRKEDAKMKLRERQAIRRRCVGLERVVSVCKTMMDTAEQGASLKETVRVMRTFRPRDVLGGKTAEELDAVLQDLGETKAASDEIAALFEEQVENSDGHDISEAELDAYLDTLGSHAASDLECELSLPEPPTEPPLAPTPKPERMLLFNA